jgi:tripartite-type tricarboxylate transporter receptor subunit TctC
MSAAIFVGSTAASAQTWPTRQVRFIVSLGPGSGVDISARLLADRLTTHWRQPVIIENKPGADGVVAINAMIGAHDDHTFLYTPTSSFTAHPYVLGKLPYDPSALVPVAQVYRAWQALVVNRSLNVASVAELIALIRSQPGKLNYSTGTGMSDLIYDGYFRSAGLTITRVPYRDVVAPMADLADGRIQAYEAGIPVVQPHVEAGRAKLIAIASSVRAPAYPDVPTVAEAGFPALTFDGLTGLLGPREMTAVVRDRVAADVVSALADPVVVSRLNAIGAAAIPGGAAEFTAAIEQQRAKLAEIAKVLGLKRHAP